MIDETMYGEVSSKFEKIANGISSKSVPMTQLRHYDRYIYLQYQKNHIWIGLGYWMNSFNKEREYPELKFVIEVSPKSPKYSHIKDIMSKIVKENKIWTGYNLDIPESWSGIYISRSLRSFMHTDNHVENIKTYFNEAIGKYEKVKSDFGELI